MDPVILSGAALIDGTGTEPVRGRSVVIEDGRIVDVVDDARLPQGSRIDLSGATLLPGLINCHVHLSVTAIKAAVRARQTLDAGVTTVRDLGGRDYCELGLKRAIQDGLIPGPRILAAGRP